MFKKLLLAFMCLPTFSTVSPQNTNDVVNTYLRVTSSDDLIENGVYVVADKQKKENIAIMAEVKNRKRTYIEVSPDSMRNDMLFLSSKYVANDEKSSNKVYELVIRNKDSNNFYFYDIANKKYLDASTSEKKSNTDQYLELSQFPNNQELKRRCTVNILFKDGETNHLIKFNPEKDHAVYNTQLKFTGTYFVCGYSTDYEYCSQLYRKVIPIKITNAGYSTLYADYAFQMPEGLSGGIVKAQDGTNNLIVDYCYQSGDIVSAYTPLILKGEAKEYYATVMSTEGKTVEGNQLYGTVDDKGMTSVNQDDGSLYKYYKAAQYRGEVGFWWNEEGGKPFRNAKNKAYLALSHTATSKGFSLENMEQTGIASVTTEHNHADTRIFDLNGKQMPQTQTRSLPAGVYIINGKATIVNHAQ